MIVRIKVNIIVTEGVAAAIAAAWIIAIKQLLVRSTVEPTT